MEEKNYNEISNLFFDDCEKQIEKTVKTKRICLLVSLISFVAIYGVCFAAGSINSDIFWYIVLIPIIACFVGFVLRKRAKDKLKLELKQLENRFFDEVYMQIVADKLDARINSKSTINASFKKENANVGDVIKARDVEIAGFYNGCPYKISTGTETVVESILYHNSTKTVVSYEPKTIDRELMCNYSIKRKIDSSISISSPMARGTLIGMICGPENRVKMDNKKFHFEVGCDNPVTAYKFLTADVMESIMAFDKIVRIDGMLISDQDMTVLSPNMFVDLKYSPKFSKNMKKNRERYSGNSVFPTATEAANKITEYLSYTPVALISYHE